MLCRCKRRQVFHAFALAQIRGWDLAFELLLPRERRRAMQSEEEDGEEEEEDHKDSARDL